MNKNKPSDDRYFRTNSLNTASFLFAKGFELANVDKTQNPKRAEFVFVNSAELQLHLELFQTANRTEPEVLVDARILFNAIKQIKTILYQE